MANWWFLYLMHIDDVVLILGPLTFIGINFLYSKFMHKKEYGMMMFAISLSALVFITVLNKKMIIPATSAILVLGYADPLAALIGKGYHRNDKRIYSKSLIGSITFAIVSMIILTLIFRYNNVPVRIYEIVLYGCFFAFVENKIFPKYDNITIPFSVFICIYLRGMICGLY